MQKNAHEGNLLNIFCDISKCTFRHPRTCKQISEHNRCKFDPCAYKHIEKDDNCSKLKKENKEVMKKLEAIENDLKLLKRKKMNPCK